MYSYPHFKVLITGGAGFIGSHLVELLLAQDVEVIVLDNFSTGLHNNLPSHKKLTLIEGSIVDRDVCARAAQDVSCIFHLAAHISVPLSVARPFECYETNIRGTYNLLEAARNNNVKHFIFSSSAAVYGAHEGYCDEEITPCNPLSPYGTSKLMGEMLCKEYGTLYGIRSVCLRYFNVYGKRQRTDLLNPPLVAYLTHAMQNNKPITIFGDGMQQRDFVPVEHVVSANIRASIALLQNNWHGEAINIATGQSQSVRDFIAQMHQQFPDYNINNIKFAPPRAGDIKFSAACREKYDKLKEIYSYEL